MKKYSTKFKLKVVEYYINNNYGYHDVARYFDIPNHKSVEEWVKKYQIHGINGLVSHKKIYSGEFKQNVLEYMHSNHLSLRETSYHFNLGSTSMILRWERIYYEEGPQGLYIERRGRSKNMSSKQKKKKLDKEVEEDLIAENQRLRMENEYLKKLNALVQERIKRENKKK